MKVQHPENGGLVPFVYHPSEDEMRLCRAAADERDSSARRQGRKDQHGAPTDQDRGYRLHLVGVAGELGFARFQHLDDWTPTVDTFRSMPDVGAFEVRCRSRHSYDLLIRSGDRSSSRYILATCEDLREVWVWGWVWGEEAKQDRFLASHGGREPAYFIPKAHLEPLDLLPWKGVE